MGLREKLENLMVAITFAEAGESDTTREVLEREKHAEKARKEIKHIYSPRHTKRVRFDILP